MGSIIKNKWASSINITGLSLDMAAAVLILLWILNELSFDNYHREAGNIHHVTMGNQGEAMQFDIPPVRLPEIMQKVVPDVEMVTDLVAANNITSPVLNVNENYFGGKKRAFIDKEWFNLLTHDLLLTF